MVIRFDDGMICGTRLLSDEKEKEGREFSFGKRERKEVENLFKNFQRVN